MARQLLEELTPSHWDSGKPASGSGFNRVRWLQGISDLVNRPVLNRSNVASSAPVAVNTTGAVQSTGIGISNRLQPKRYGEFTVKARVTFNINSAGPAFCHVYRTLGAIPANGAAPNAGDVVVGGGAFAGGPTSNGVDQVGTFSFLDTGLDRTKQYNYYLTVEASNGAVLNLDTGAQLFVMERS